MCVCADNDADDEMRKELIEPIEIDSDDEMCGERITLLEERTPPALVKIAEPFQESAGILVQAANELSAVANSAYISALARSMKARTPVAQSYSSHCPQSAPTLLIEAHEFLNQAYDGLGKINLDKFYETDHEIYGKITKSMKTIALEIQQVSSNPHYIDASDPNAASSYPSNPIIVDIDAPVVLIGQPGFSLARSSEFRNNLEESVNGLVSLIVGEFVSDEAVDETPQTGNAADEGDVNCSAAAALPHASQVVGFVAPSQDSMVPVIWGARPPMFPGPTVECDYPLWCEGAHESSWSNIAQVICTHDALKFKILINSSLVCPNPIGNASLWLRRLMTTNCRSRRLIALM